MIPVLLRIPEWVPLFGSQAITSFSVCMLVAFIVCGRLFSAGLERRDMPKSFAWEILVAAVVAGVIGAKLLYAVTHPADVRADPSAVLFGRGGLVWQGALIAGAAAVIALARAKQLRVSAVLDAAAAPAALGFAIGRIGSFLVGSDYGLPTTGPLGVAFARGTPPTTRENLDAYFNVPVPMSERGALGYVSVHPTQLYEAAFSVVLFAWLFVRERKAPERRTGGLFAAWLALGSAFRFLIEFLRAKDDRVMGPFTIDQAIALLLVVTAAVVYTRLRVSAC